MNLTFWYLPRSIVTIFLVVYEPQRALEGLQGVRFQGKNCFTKVVSNFSEINFGFKQQEKMSKKHWYLPGSIETIFLVFYEPHSALEGLQFVRFQSKNCSTKTVSNFSEINFGFKQHEKMSKKHEYDILVSAWVNRFFFGRS